MRRPENRVTLRSRFVRIVGDAPEAAAIAASIKAKRRGIVMGTSQAEARLRRQDGYSGSLALSVKCHVMGRHKRYARFIHTQDSMQLLRHLNRLWQDIPVQRPKSVGVMLGRIVPRTDHVADLFEARDQSGNATVQETLCHMIDGLNRKYGQNTIRFGELPRYCVPYTGAKIAFGRVPEQADFHE